MGGSLVFLVVLIAVGGWWLMRNKDRMVDRVRGVVTEGTQWGRGREDTACLERGFAKTDDCGAFRLDCRVEAGVFLRACLSAAEPTVDFCEGVPSPDDAVDSIAYRLKECTARGRASDDCGQVLAVVQSHCHQP
jgi:hypothetical protein